MARHARSDPWRDGRQEDCHWWREEGPDGREVWRLECHPADETAEDAQLALWALATGDIWPEYCPWCGALWVDAGPPEEVA